jgi:penicillin-binding protein 1C
LERLPICARSGHRAGADCPDVDTTWVPALAARTPTCPYHHLIRVDPSHRYRVTATAPGEELTWFVLPPAMEHFYAPGDPSYRPLPPWADRELSTQADSPMEMIYPENGSVVMLPVELDGSTGRAVFEVAHRERNARLHWHLDNEFIGTTDGSHRFAVAPATGGHTLLLTDNDGHSISVHFVVVGGVKGS